MCMGYKTTLYMAMYMSMVNVGSMLVYMNYKFVFMSMGVITIFWYFIIRMAMCIVLFFIFISSCQV